jgi:hypothetical protein
LFCFLFVCSGKHLHDHIISLRGEVWAHKCSLTPSYFIVVHVPSQESERSCISELRVSVFPLPTLFLLEFGNFRSRFYLRDFLLYSSEANFMQGLRREDEES